MIVVTSDYGQHVVEDYEVDQEVVDMTAFGDTTNTYWKRRLYFQVPFTVNPESLISMDIGDEVRFFMPIRIDCQASINSTIVYDVTAVEV